MSTPGRTTFLVLCAATLALEVSLPARADEDEAVRAVALDYAEGWALADAERMARALHPQALRRRVVVDILSDAPRVQVMDAAELIRATGEGAGRPPDDAPLNLRVAILDRHGDLAVARVVSPLYVHYLQLVRWQDRWVVLSIVWGTVAAPGE